MLFNLLTPSVIGYVPSEQLSPFRTGQMEEPWTFSFILSAALQDYDMNLVRMKRHSRTLVVEVDDYNDLSPLELNEQYTSVGL